MKLPVAIPDLSGNEEAYVVDALRSSWVSSQGPYLKRFEQEFASVCGTRHAIAVSNGTVALHLALVGLDIGPGDEVIVPSLTYIASVNAIRYVGASPVFVDVDPRSQCLDPDAVAAALTERTRAVIAVHLYGQPAEMDALRDLCEPRGIRLVEDAAEAPMATYRGRPTGGLGDVATFSFYGNKVLTCGEGGAVTLDDDDLAARLRLLRGQGMEPNRRYWFSVVGYNYRLTNVAAALLCAQLERRGEILDARKRIFAQYTERLASVPGLTIPTPMPGTTTSPWLFSMLVDEGLFGIGRDVLMQRLESAGIETRPFFPPIHLLPPYVDERRGPLAVTERLAGQGMNLPTYPGMTEDDVTRICDEILLHAHGKR
jgi:perosamine synthetase